MSTLEHDEGVGYHSGLVIIGLVFGLVLGALVFFVLYRNTILAFFAHSSTRELVDGDPRKPYYRDPLGREDLETARDAWRKKNDDHTHTKTPDLPIHDIVQLNRAEAYNRNSQAVLTAVEHGDMNTAIAINSAIELDAREPFPYTTLYDSQIALGLGIPSSADRYTPLDAGDFLTPHERFPDDYGDNYDDDDDDDSDDEDEKEVNDNSSSGSISGGGGGGGGHVNRMFSSTTRPRASRPNLSPIETSRLIVGTSSSNNSNKDAPSPSAPTQAQPPSSPPKDVVAAKATAPQTSNGLKPFIIPERTPTRPTSSSTHRGRRNISSATKPPPALMPQLLPTTSTPTVSSQQLRKQQQEQEQNSTSASANSVKKDQASTKPKQSTNNNNNNNNNNNDGADTTTPTHTASAKLKKTARKPKRSYSYSSSASKTKKSGSGLVFQESVNLST